MGIDNVNNGNIQNSSVDAGAKKRLSSSNFKNLFLDINSKLEGISKQFADPDSTEVTLDGVKYKKDDPGTLFLLQRTVSKLDNLNSLGLDLLTKKGSFEDQVSKMVG